MRIGFISDIHANFEALESVLKKIKTESLDQVICLGDLVGYGPDPNLCIERIMEVCQVVLAGNHDYCAVNKETLDRFNEDAKISLQWTKEILSDENAKILSDLPLIMMDGEIMGVHATPDNPKKWFYLTSQKDAERCLSVTPVSFCFVGHSHTPIIFMQDTDGQVVMEFGLDIRFYEDTKYIINIGSVGQPRDGDPRAAYGIMDTEEGTFVIERCTYDIQKVQDKMIKIGSPERLIRRLAIGK